MLLLAALDTRLDEVFSDRVDPSVLLSHHVRSILAEFMRSGRVISIDDVFSRSSQRWHAEEVIATDIMEYMKEGLFHLHAVQTLFDPEMKKARDPPYTDVHPYNTYGAFHDGFVDHAEKFLKIPHGVTPEIRAVTEKIIRFDPETSGVTLTRPIHLSMKHGAHGIPHEPRYSVALQVSRIKDQIRVSQKFSRYICKGILDYETLSAAIQDAKREVEGKKDKDLELDKAIRKLSLSDKIAETLTAMYYYDLQTPFADPDSGLYRLLPDPLEYIALRGRVSDGFGVIDIAPTREKAKNLMSRLVHGDFQRSEHYGVLFGYRLAHVDGGLHYVPDFVIDNHYIRQNKYLPNGDQNMFTYILPRWSHSRFHFRIDFGVYGWEDYCQDAVGGEGSHLLYEKKQEEEVQGWRLTKPALFQLYESIRIATHAILERIDISPLEVYSGEGKKREALLAK